MLGYVITRQRDVHDVHTTRVVREIDYWSDHRLVSCTVVLNLCAPKHRHAHVHRKKLDISLLKMQDAKTQLLSKLDPALARDPEQVDNPVSIEDEWADITDTTYQTAAVALGFNAARRHQDWFDEHDAEARILLDTMHTTHHA
jgi:hypothetical protein